MDSPRKRIALYALLVFVTGTSAGCSVFQASGRWTRESGESMESYSKSNEGFWASMAAFGGRINKAVGGAIESMAGSGRASTDAAAGTEVAPAPTGTAAQADAPRYAVVAPVAVTAPLAAQPVDEAAMTTRAQARLLEMGYRIGKADGILGPRTKAALRQYQRTNGLSETGALDEATLIALGLG